jgi:arylsulfatase A-like enzyme
MYRAALLVIGFLAASAPAWADLKPNIVFIMADDLDYERGNWNRYPNLRALASQGLTFRNHFVSNGLCCPSRASILRGQYCHNTGIFTNEGPHGGFATFRRLGRETSTVGTWLRAAGYRTVLMGKYFNGYEPTSSKPPGWTMWYVGGKAGYNQFNYDLNENGTIVHYGSAPADYLQDVLRDKALSFIHGSSPFFLMMWSYTPHGPSPAAPRHIGTFPKVQAPRTETFNEPDVSQQPEWVQRAQVMPPPQVEYLDTHYRKRLQSMLALDETVGAVIKELERTGQLNNTYIIFTSDNGVHLGQHRLGYGKQTGFDEDLRVPLIVRGPGIPAGRTIDALTVNIDFAPTLAELAGALTPAFVDGRSLVPLLDGTPPRVWRHSLLLEHRHYNLTTADADAVADGDLAAPWEKVRQPSFDGVRTRRWSYMQMVDGEIALYDTTNDPGEHINVAASRPSLVARLAAKTNVLKTCLGQACRDAEDAP